MITKKSKHVWLICDLLYYCPAFLKNWHSNLTSLFNNKILNHVLICFNRVKYDAKCRHKGNTYFLKDMYTIDIFEKLEDVNCQGSST